jgi:hypothetical protein
MGGLSVWHLIIALLFLAATVGSVGLLVWLFARSSKRPVSQAASGEAGSEPVLATAESRLLHLDDLWAKGVITESEYEQQRAVIIKGI